MEIKEHKGRKVTNASAVANLLQAILDAEQENDQKKEHFWAIGLNTRLEVEYVELVSLGTLNANLVHPREVFRLAILKSVATLIVRHNHPSGDTTPSEDDIELTQRLINAGKIMDIELTDHVIIGKGYYSWADNGLIKGKG